MAGLIVIASDIAGAEEIRDLFVAYGYEAVLRGYRDAILFGNPRAILLALHNRELPADERAAGLRAAGYQGVIFVLGRIAPDLAIRQRLAQHKAWFMPSISGPGDVVARVRQLLG